MALDARRTEGGVVCLEEHHAHDVVADVALPLQFLGIVPLVRQLRGNVKHNLYRTPVCINGVKSYVVREGKKKIVICLLFTMVPEKQRTC